MGIAQKIGGPHAKANLWSGAHVLPCHMVGSMPPMFERSSSKSHVILQHVEHPRELVKSVGEWRIPICLLWNREGNLHEI